MSDAIIAALITSTAAIFFAPLIARAINARFERRASLHAVLEFSRHAMPPILEEFVQKRARELEFNDPTRDGLLDQKHLYGFAALKIKNTSTKKIQNVTVRTGDVGNAYYSVGEDSGNASKTKLIAVGDLQPGHERTVHVWCSRHLPDSSSYEMARNFRISADELDRVHYEYPFPPYLDQRVTILPRWVKFLWTVLSLTIAATLPPLIVIMLLKRFFG